MTRSKLRREIKTAGGRQRPWSALGLAFSQKGFVVENVSPTFRHITIWSQKIAARVRLIPMANGRPKILGQQQGQGVLMEAISLLLEGSMLICPDDPSNIPSLFAAEVYHAP